jgi:hypothetical protein
MRIEQGIPQLPGRPQRYRALRERGGPGRKVAIPLSLLRRFGFEVSSFWGAGMPMYTFSTGWVLTGYTVESKQTTITTRLRAWIHTARVFYDKHLPEPRNLDRLALGLETASCAGSVLFAGVGAVVGGPAGGPPGALAGGVAGYAVGVGVTAIPNVAGNVAGGVASLHTLLRVVDDQGARGLVTGDAFVSYLGLAYSLGVQDPCMGMAAAGGIALYDDGYWQNTE